MTRQLVSCLATVRQICLWYRCRGFGSKNKQTSSVQCTIGWECTYVHVYNFQEIRRTQISHFLCFTEIKISILNSHKPQILKWKQKLWSALRCAPQPPRTLWSAPSPYPGTLWCAHHHHHQCLQAKPRQMNLIMCFKMKIPVNENSEDEILPAGAITWREWPQLRCWPRLQNLIWWWTCNEGRGCGVWTLQWNVKLQRMI